MTLIAYFKKECDYALEGLYRCCATTQCLLGAFLFVGGSNGRGPIMLLKLIDEIHHRNNPVSLVLAEIILCLDRLCHYPD